MGAAEFIVSHIRELRNFITGACPAYFPTPEFYLRIRYKPDTKWIQKVVANRRTDSTRQYLLQNSHIGHRS